MRILAFWEAGIQHSTEATDIRKFTTRVEHDHNVTKETECFVSLQTSDFLAEYCNVTANSEELVGMTEYLTI